MARLTQSKEAAFAGARGAALIGVCLVLGACECSKRQTEEAAGEVAFGTPSAAMESAADATTPQDRPSAVYASDFQRQYPPPEGEKTSDDSSIKPVASDAKEPGAATPAMPLPNAPLKARNTRGQPIEVDVMPASEARGGVGDVTVHAEAPPVFVAGHGASQVSESVQVDAIVGAINGKPVRASEFLTPLSGVLSAKKIEAGMTREAWRMFAVRTISERLSAEIRDELLVTAGMADLTPPEREQLSVYMLGERRKIVALFRGSEEAADRALREKGLGGLAEVMKEKKREFVIARIKELRIFSRIQVSMRDIEVYYRQHPERFDSPSQYVFRLIEASTADADRVHKIAARLASGDAFADVASSSLNTFHAADGGKLSKPHESATPQASAAFFGVAPLNEAAQKVKVGAWIGPIEDQGTTYWMFLDEIVDRRMTLFDAQIEIEDEIRNERANEEFRRYLFDLLSKGSYTSIDQMALALLKIAEDQLWGPSPTGAIVTPEHPEFDADEKGG